MHSYIYWCLLLSWNKICSLGSFCKRHVWAAEEESCMKKAQWGQTHSCYSQSRRSRPLGWKTLQKHVQRQKLNDGRKIIIHWGHNYSSINGAGVKNNDGNNKKTDKFCQWADNDFNVCSFKCFKKKKKTLFSFWKCAFLLPSRFEMKSRQTWSCSQRVRLCVLFHRLVFKVSSERRRRPCCVNHTAAWAKKVPEDGIFHNREERLRFPIFDVLRRSSRGRDQCLRSCIKQSSCTENQQKLKEKTRENFDILGKGRKKTTALRGRFCSKVSTSNLRFCFYHICADRFSSHVERTCTAPNTARWLAFKMQLWLTEASRSLWTDAKLLFEFQPGTSSDPQPNTYTVSTKWRHRGEECNSSLTHLSQMRTKASRDWGESNKLSPRSRVWIQRYCVKFAGTSWCFVLSRDLRWPIIASQVVMYKSWLVVQQEASPQTAPWNYFHFSGFKKGATRWRCCTRLGATAAVVIGRQSRSVSLLCCVLHLTAAVIRVHWMGPETKKLIDWRT